MHHLECICGLLSVILLLIIITRWASLVMAGFQIICSLDHSPLRNILMTDLHRRIRRVRCRCRIQSYLLVRGDLRIISPANVRFFEQLWHLNFLLACHYQIWHGCDSFILRLRQVLSSLVNLLRFSQLVPEAVAQVLLAWRPIDFALGHDGSGRAWSLGVVSIDHRHIKLVNTDLIRLLHHIYIFFIFLIKNSI